MKTGIAVCDAMTQRPVYVTPSTNLKECARLMKENRVGSLLVKDNKKLVGIFTERDMVRKAVALNKSPQSVCAGDIMVKDVITISPDRDIFDAIIKMREYDIRHLPVVDRNRAFVGLLTIKDILKIQPSLFELYVDIFNLREEARKPIPKRASKVGLCRGCGDYSEELEQVAEGLFCPNCVDEAE